MKSSLLCLSKYTFFEQHFFSTHLKCCLLGVSGDPSLIWPNLKGEAPLILQASTRFLGGSAVSVRFRMMASVSSSNAGRLLFRSSSRW
jgi:hypothetical protein